MYVYGRGVWIDNERAETLKEPLEILPAGDLLILPVCPVQEQEKWNLPEEGEYISRSAPLAKERDGAGCAWTSVSGEVIGFAEKELPGKGMWLCVKLHPDSTGKGGKRKLNRPSQQEISLEALIATAVEKRLVDEIDGRLLAEKLEEWSREKIRVLVCDAVCDDPYNTDALCALNENTEEVMSGLRLAARACECAESMVVTYRKYNIGVSEVRRLNRELKDQKMLDVTGKYPIWPKLEKSKRIPKPFGRIGVQACARLHRAFYLQRPPERCVITIAGDGLVRNRNLSVVIGTPISTVLSYCEHSIDGIRALAVGGSITGHATQDADVPVLQDTRCVLALARGGVQKQDPCISCGKCNEVCCQHVFASEALLMLYRKEPERAIEYGVGRCIGCGACSMVCPSSLPVSQILFKAAQNAAKKTEKEKQDVSAETEMPTGATAPENLESENVPNENSGERKAES